MATVVETPPLGDVLRGGDGDGEPGRERPRVVALRFYRAHRATIGYLFLVAVIFVVGGYAYRGLADNDSQFCRVASQRLLDKQQQIAQTTEYLGTHAGQERTGLNDYIRTTSQPRLRAEVRSDKATLPSACQDEYDDLAAKQTH